MNADLHDRVREGINSGDVEALVGTVRDDRLVGGTGVNRLTGGLGVDSLASGGGSDTFAFRDGVRDRCYSVSGGVTVDLDLTDPTLDDCRISLLPTTTKLTRSPTDETMPPPVIGTTVRRSRGRLLLVTIRCDREAPKACSGRLTAEPARGGRRIARRAFRVRAGATRRVALSASTTVVRNLRTTRLTARGRGVSRRGDTTVIAQRRVK